MNWNYTCLSGFLQVKVVDRINNQKSWNWLWKQENQNRWQPNFETKTALKRRFVCIFQDWTNKNEQNWNWQKKRHASKNISLLVKSWNDAFPFQRGAIGRKIVNYIICLECKFRKIHNFWNGTHAIFHIFWYTDSWFIRLKYYIISCICFFHCEDYNSNVKTISFNFVVSYKAQSKWFRKTWHLRNWSNVVKVFFNEFQSVLIVLVTKNWSFILE